jgi:hypothetical protein
MGQSRPSLASEIVNHVLDDISNAHPDVARHVFQFASYAESLLSRIPGYQSTDSDTRCLWSGYKPSICSREELGLTIPSVSHLKHTNERLAAKYNPSTRLTMGTCTSFCPSENQYSPQIEAHPTHTTACTGTESTSPSMQERRSSSDVPPSYEDLHPHRLATPNSERKANRRVDYPSSPKQYQPSKSVSFAGTSPTETKQSRHERKTANSSRESSLPRRPGELDATLGNYPVQGELPGYPGPCRGDSGGPSIDGIGGAGSGRNNDGIGGGGGGGVGGDGGGGGGVGGIDLGGCQLQ